MVKNHKAKIDARNTGGKYTAALAKVTSEGSKYVAPVLSDRLSTEYMLSSGYKRGSQNLANLFVGSVHAFYDVGDDLERADYDEAYTDGIEGMSIKEVVLEHGGLVEGVTLDEIPEPPTSAQLVELFGSWSAVNAASGLKSFNGWLGAYTEAEGTAPDYDGGVDGVSEWPRWVGIGYVKVPEAESEFQGNMQVYKEDGQHTNVTVFYRDLRPGDKLADDILAKIKVALGYADMAYAISEGVEPDPVVLASWQERAGEWMEPNSLPNAVQLSVLKQARKYLTPYLQK